MKDRDYNGQMFEDTKEVINSVKSMKYRKYDDQKYRKYDGQKKKYKQ
jgi:hypothetical protein